MEKVPAYLEDLIVNISFNNGVVRETEMAVTYSFLYAGSRILSEMDLNEWQKLPPVPRP
jgi:hypothetical protein